ncbi:hypothetical protein K474DRAFT_1674799 [Panus rudis PR-1116 ss-1]|nr:hypothetical protein K474DRAFT_1674799 [Panus rudis PR-1116 ss-1]
MSATPATLFPTPPPTRNHLDPQQRARLVRSARKLGAVLGATPQLIDTDYKPRPIPISLLPIGGNSTKPKIHRRQGSALPSNTASPQSLYASSSSSANSSVASLVLPPPRSSFDTLPTPKSFSTNPRRSGDAPRPLMLRLNQVMVPPAPVRDTPETPSTTTSLRFAHHATDDDTPITPLTPATPTPAEMKRRRMAKLQRTLGENVPPELVFSSAPKSRLPSNPPVPDPSATPRPRKHHSHSQSVASGAEDAFARRSRIWITGATTWEGAWNRKDIKDVQKQLRNLRAR